MERTEEPTETNDESTSSYDSLINHMVNAFARHRIVTDEEGNPVNYEFLEVNPAFEQMVGLKEEEVVGKLVTDVLLDIQWTNSDWIRRFASVALSGESVFFEQYLEPLERWFSVGTFSPKRGQFVTIFTDITEHVKTEERLKNTLQQLKRRDRVYRLLTKGNQTMLKAEKEDLLLQDICRVVVDTGRYTLAWIAYTDTEASATFQVKAAFGEQHGYVERIVDAMGKSGKGLYYEQTLTSQKPTVVRQTDNERQRKWYHRIMAQHGFVATIALPLKVNNEVIGFLNVCSEEESAFREPEAATLENLASDLSYGIEMLRTRRERQRLRKDIEEKSKFLQAILRSTADSVLVVDTKGKVIYYNQRFLELWRVPEDLVQVADVDRLITFVKNQLTDPEDFEQRTRELMNSSRVEQYILRFKDGREYERHSQPLVLEGKAMGRVWISTDVTSIMQAKNRAHLYLDLMTHDIRNALQGISVGIDLVRMRDQNPEVVDSALQQMEESLKKCTGLVSKVQDMKDVQDDRLIAVSLTEVLEGCIEEILAGVSDVDAVLDIPQEDATIMADSQLRCLIMNLLENAVQHNDADKKELYVSLAQKDKGYELCVGDNGSGINPKRRRELFDPNRRYGGIGLHIISQLVEKYGGQVRVRDRVDGSPSEGAEFIVWLPSSGD